MVTAAPAGAADGESVLLGQVNEATTPTRITTTSDGETTEVVIGAPGPWARFAQSDSTAILGAIPAGGVAGVNGEAVDTVGVLGNATGAHGIGVAALSSTGPALAAQSNGDGGDVTLLLVPADREGPPTSMPPGLTGYLAGCVSVDERGDTWVCVADGAPGTSSTTSSLDFPNGVTALANAFTSQLGPNGLTISSSGTTANTHHLVVDITAYIT